MCEEYNAVNGNLAAKVNKLENSNERLTKENENLKSRVSELETDVAGLKEVVAAIMSRIERGDAA